MRTSRPADPRRAALAVALVVVALGLPSRATDLPRRLVVHRSHDGTAWVDVPVSHPRKNGPRTVAMAIPGLPAGVTSLTGSAVPVSDPAPPATATTAATAEPAPRYGPDDAREFPVDAPDDPGTITTVAGGICDGYPAAEATITPTRVALSAGTLWWLDDDGSNSSMIGHDRGSLLLRRLTADGRVKTVGPLVEPEEGRYARLWFDGYERTALASDDHGGVYVAVSFTSGGFGGTTKRYGDEPLSTTILHVAPDGTRKVVAGGGKPHVGPGQYTHPAPGGDPALGASLGRITGLAADPYGNLFFVEGDWDSDDAATIGFVNRTGHSVVFYANTPYTVTVRAGRVGTIAGDLYARGLNLGFANAGGHGEGGPARQAQVPTRTNLAYANGFLYLLAGFQDTYSVNTSEASPGEVEAINLGLDSGDVRAAVTIAPGNVDRLAGVLDAAGNSTVVDGVPARTAAFKFDTGSYGGGLAIARDGDILVADSLHNAVRRIDDTTGLITTVAGTATYGYDGDGLPARQSRIAYPIGVAVDKHDRLVFADVRNARIREVTKDGRLVTVAGRGPTPCGDGHLATGRDLYGGMYIGEQHDVATDSTGRMFVVDAQYAVIRRIGPDGRVEASVGVPQGCAYSGGYNPPGTPSPCAARTAGGDDGPFAAALLAAPHFVTVDAYDNLYLTDGSDVRYVNFRTHPVSVLGVTAQPGTIKTVYSFGARSVHVIIPPWVNTDVTLSIGDLAVDDDGSLFVGDTSLYRVWRIDPCGKLTAVAGSGVAPSGAAQGDGGPALNAALAPVGIALDRARRLLYVYDSGRNFIDAGSGLNRARIRVVNLAAAAQQTFAVAVPALGITTVAGGAVCSGVCSFGDGGPAIAAGLSGNSSLALSQGRLYFADPDDNRVRVILPDGTVAGIAAPWPEARNAQAYGENTPSLFGTRGDGGRALDAWVAVGRFDYGFYSSGTGFIYWPSVLATTPGGDLLVGDEGGRVRRIANPVDAPLRLSASVPGLDGAGVGFSSPLVLHHPMPNANDTLPTADTTLGVLGTPDLATYGGTTSLVGSLGGGAGCVLWTVTANADGKGKDSASEPVGVGAGGLVSPIGGRGCRVAGTSADSVTVASTHDVRDGSGTRYEAALPVSTTADRGAQWRTAFADATRAGGADRGAVALAGDTLVYAGADGVLHAVRTAGGTAFADAGSPGRDVVSLGTATAAGDTVYVAYATATGVVVSRSAGAAWTARTVAVVPPRAVVSPPAVAVGRDGTVYVTWSQDGAVHLAVDGAVRQVVSHGATLPDVAAGAAGEAVVAWYGTPEPRVRPDDPYARWYVYTARLSHGRITVGVATATPVHVGPFLDTTATSVTPAGAVGAVRVRVGTAGRAELAYRTDPSLAGNSSTAPALGFLRACAGAPLVPAKPVPCTLNPPPARWIGDDLAPPPPPPPPLGNPVVGACSPRPPAFAEPTPPPAPRTRPGRRSSREIDVPPAARVAGVVGVVPPIEQPPPGEPESIPGTENANATQHGTVTQPGYGAAPDEEEQAELVTATERDRHEPAGDLLAMVALVTASAAALHWRRRTQISAAAQAVAPIRYPSRRPG